mmetsp:Transcript_48534/g.113797  ORF Transcript_48534/g.113797 Transcript_48534/m.113797 type:complete len:204 (-) Transcript_48534:362-973(-)
MKATTSVSGRAFSNSSVRAAFAPTRKVRGTKTEGLMTKRFLSKLDGSSRWPWRNAASSKTHHSLERYDGSHTTTSIRDFFNKAPRFMMPSAFNLPSPWWMHVRSRKTLLGDCQKSRRSKAEAHPLRFAHGLNLNSPLYPGPWRRGSLYHPGRTSAYERYATSAAISVPPTQAARPFFSMRSSHTLRKTTLCQLCDQNSSMEPT